MALLQLNLSKNCGLIPTLASKSRACGLDFPLCSGVLKCPSFSTAIVSEKTNRELGCHLDIICQKVISSAPPCPLSGCVNHTGKSNEALYFYLLPSREYGPGKDGSSLLQGTSL